MKLLGNRRALTNANIHIGLRLFGLWDELLGRANFRFTDTRVIRIPVFGPEFFRSSQMRLCRRHEQQSRAEPLNAKIRSGAEDEAEIETDRERWMDFFCGSEVTVVTFFVVQTYRSWNFVQHLLSFHISFFLLFINKAL